jgi:hypothetical protein
MHHGAKPTQEPRTTKLKLETQLRQDKTTFHHRRREDAATAMGGTDMGCSNEDKEQTLQEAAPKPRRRTTSRATSLPTQHEVDTLNTVRVLGPPPRHPSTPPHPADRQHHFPGPPSRHTTARHDATRPSNPQPELHKASHSQTTTIGLTSGAAAPA